MRALVLALVLLGCSSEPVAPELPNPLEPPRVLAQSCLEQCETARLRFVGMQIEQRSGAAWGHSVHCVCEVP
jgi:hypothetical protein